MRATINILYAVIGVHLLVGCATPVGQAALRAVGMSEKEEAGRKLQLVLSAGDSVNSDKSGRGNALVLRVFKLRNQESFLALSREAFDSGGVAPAGLKEDLLGSKEHILTPGQQYQAEELLPPGTRYVGLMMMFQSSQPARWRTVLQVSALDDKPLLVGVHRCSFTITQGLSDKELLKTLSRAGSAACN
ncbi:type VI secretion system lipoprotein TssJ [Chitinimonas sp. BJB300]|uniref:type VI secretion system lipoprotein TssJ n=1 Tax=Chitinimonas sp. BJB300 TaxID=1559339 RepID=UPI000C0F43B3|nr:type VI secretion system lipoprotein TssJ [Chitinimonas sp. BJB300]PHV13184.1 type VI secretion system lipoprotein TssJ [Chitinimonas sp. BJB300]TSJ87166.1 type VI secretion system lipoprotein TssJ [Chitinimonas sp. BJB300]